MWRLGKKLVKPHEMGMGHASDRREQVQLASMEKRVRGESTSPQRVFIVRFPENGI
jgi:hypothetical protein